MTSVVFYAVTIAILTMLGAGLAGQLAAREWWHKWIFWGTGILIVILVYFQARSYTEPPTLAQIVSAFDQKYSKNEPKPNGPAPNYEIKSPTATQIADAIASRIPPNTLGSFSYFTDERLIELTEATIKDLSNEQGIWNDDMVMTTQTAPLDDIRSDMLRSDGTRRPMNKKEADARWEEAKKAPARIDKRMMEETKNLALRACDLRSEIFDNRLNTEEKQAMLSLDHSNAEIFARLKSGKYGMHDLGYASAYLGELQKKLESHIVH